MAQKQEPCYAQLPPEVQGAIASFLKDHTTRVSLLAACRAGRDAVIRGAPNISLRFPLSLSRAELKSRASVLARVAHLRPKRSLLRLHLSLSGDEEAKRYSDRVAWMLGLCVQEAGDRAWHLSLEGVLLGNKLVPDYLPRACPGLLALTLSSCYISHAAAAGTSTSRAGRRRQATAVAHATLQSLTFDGGVKAAGTPHQPTAQQLTDTLRLQLPTLPALHTVVINSHNAADGAAMPHAGVLGPQLHRLHIKQTAAVLPSWQQAVRPYAAYLTNLTHVHLEKPGFLDHDDMTTLLQLPAVTHLTIPAFVLFKFESLSHRPCTWQELRVLPVRQGTNMVTSTVALGSLARIPLGSLQHPIHIKAGFHTTLQSDEQLAHVATQGAAVDDMRALVERLQRVGGVAWPDLYSIGVLGWPGARAAASRWFLEALPLMPAAPPQVQLREMELSTTLLNALSAKWAALSTLVLTFVDCRLNSTACAQLLVRLPTIVYLTIEWTEGLEEGGVEEGDLEGLCLGLAGLCRASVHPLKVELRVHDARVRRSLQAAALGADDTHGWGWVRVKVLPPKEDTAVDVSIWNMW